METGAVITLIGAIVAAISAICAICTFVINRRKDGYQNGQDSGELKGDIKYMRSGFDDIRLDVKEIKRKTDDQADRLTRVEESTKQAHKRIDEIRNELNREDNHHEN